MQAYFPTEPSGSDYETIPKNGTWYEEWQSGYDDIIKRGFPRPRTKKTILAELHSPQIEDFLHGGEQVPFLVSSEVHQFLRSAKFTGFKFLPVVVAKIATKGVRRRNSRSSEPEDAIMKARDVKEKVALPKLFGVEVTGKVEVIPDFASGRCGEDDCVSPFRLPPGNRAPPDLWTPVIGGKSFTAWTFCSSRFRAEVLRLKFTNIRFQSFDDFMRQYRKEIRDDEAS
jgi:hypothetical protein